MMKTLKELWELRIVIKDLYNFIYKHCPEYREWLEINYKEAIYGSNRTTQD